MFRSLFLTLSALLVLLLTPAIAAFAVDVRCGQSPSLGKHDGTPRMVVRGSCTAGTNLTVTLEGCPPPTTTPPIPPFMIVVRLNGWSSSAPTPMWDEEYQVWRITYRIPPGSRGATISITAMMFGTGNSTTSRVTVQ